MNSLLTIINLEGGYVEKMKILQGIYLTVDKGEAVGILGLNGSGKSTLGKAIMNLIPYRSGEILFDGQHIESKTTHELAQLGITMMHQGGVVFPNLSIWHNLTLAGWNEESDNDYDVLLKENILLLQKTKKYLTQTTADTLSGGERHKLALAMAIIRKPRLLILDEPSAGLAPKDIEAMYAILGKIKGEFDLSIILIEQNVSFAQAFCNRCVTL